MEVCTALAEPCHWTRSAEATPVVTQLQQIVLAPTQLNIPPDCEFEWAAVVTRRRTAGS